MKLRKVYVASSNYIVDNTEKLANAGRSEDIVVVKPDEIAHKMNSGSTATFVPDKETADEARRMFLNDASTRSLFEGVRPHVHQLRDVLTPRVLEFGNDPSLVETLVKIESAERKWVSWLDAIEEWGAPEEHGWDAAAQLLEASANVVSYLST